MLFASAYLIPWAATLSLKECKCETAQTHRELCCLPRLNTSTDIPRFAFFAQGEGWSCVSWSHVLSAESRYLRGLRADTVGKRNYDNAYLTSSQLCFCTWPERLKDSTAIKQSCDCVNNCTNNHTRLDKRFNGEGLSTQKGKSSA